MSCSPYFTYLNINNQHRYLDDGGESSSYDETVLDCILVSIPRNSVLERQQLLMQNRPSGKQRLAKQLREPKNMGNQGNPGKLGDFREPQKTVPECISRLSASK